MLTKLINKTKEKSKELLNMEPEHILEAKNFLYLLLTKSKEEQVEMLKYIKDGAVANAEDYINKIQKV